MPRPAGLDAAGAKGEHARGARGMGGRYTVGGIVDGSASIRSYIEPPSRSDEQVWRGLAVRNGVESDDGGEALSQRQRADSSARTSAVAAIRLGRLATALRRSRPTATSMLVGGSAECRMRNASSKS
jgi:hypothetical protein